MRSKCYRGGNQHHFEARYEDKPRNIKFERFEFEGSTEQQLKTWLTYQVYIKDICTWCGKGIHK